MATGLLGIWRSMGPVAQGVVILLLVMSLVAVAIAAERAFQLLRGRSRGLAFADKLRVHLDRGDFRAAAEVDPARGGPLAAVLGEGVRAYLRVEDQAPSTDELISSVEGSLARVVAVESAQLRRGLGALATIGSTAPFVGLFGTVVGIVNSFQEIARTGGGGIEAVSSGISEALVATALGILVAVPSVMLFNLFSTRAEAAELLLSDAAEGMIEHVRRGAWRRQGGTEKSDEPAKEPGA